MRPWKGLGGREGGWSTAGTTTGSISGNLGNPLPVCAQDKMKQNRMVRLVCVFLHSLLRSNTVNLQVSPDALEPTVKMFSCSILLLA